jgi:hypothetical protein
MVLRGVARNFFEGGEGKKIFEENLEKFSKMKIFYMRFKNFRGELAPLATPLMVLTTYSTQNWYLNTT